MRVVTKRLRLESHGFRYKVALYIGYLHMKFDDEIEGEFRQISSIISDQPASEVKLTFILCCIYSQSILLDMSITCLHRPLHRDGKDTNNIIGYGTPMQSLYSYTH